MAFFNLPFRNLPGKTEENDESSVRIAASNLVSPEDVSRSLLTQHARIFGIVFRISEINISKFLIANFTDFVSNAREL